MFESFRCFAKQTPEAFKILSENTGAGKPPDLFNKSREAGGRASLKILRVTKII